MFGPYFAPSYFARTYFPGPGGGSAVVGPDAQADVVIRVWADAQTCVVPPDRQTIVVPPDVEDIEP